MFFNSVYPIRPSNIVTKYTIYSAILLMERLFKLSSVVFYYFTLLIASKAWLKKRSCILLFETEYSLEFVSKNPTFLFSPSDTKIKTAIIW